MNRASSAKVLESNVHPHNRERLDLTPGVCRHQRHTGKEQKDRGTRSSREMGYWLATSGQEHTEAASHLA